MKSRVRTILLFAFSIISLIGLLVGINSGRDLQEVIAMWLIGSTPLIIVLLYIIIIKNYFSLDYDKLR